MKRSLTDGLQAIFLEIITDRMRNPFEFSALGPTLILAAV